MNVSYATDMVTLSPTLAFPVEGVRVEVNGQVLLRGDETAGSQAEDPAAQPLDNRCSLGKDPFCLS